MFLSEVATQGGNWVSRVAFTLPLAMTLVLCAANATAESMASKSEIETTHRLRIEALKRLSSVHDEYKYAIHTLIVPAGAISKYNFPIPVARIRYETVPLFDFDKANPRLEAIPIVEDLAARFRNDKTLARIAVVGHTDSVGSDKYNYDLSLRRATSIANLLRQHKVPTNKIEVVGLGESNPIASNATPEGQALNRRVEFYLSSIPEAINPSIRGTDFERKFRNDHDPNCRANDSNPPPECGQTGITKFPKHTLGHGGQLNARGETINMDEKPPYRVEEIPEREHIPTIGTTRPHI